MSNLEDSRNPARQLSLSEVLVAHSLSPLLNLEVSPLHLALLASHRANQELVECSARNLLSSSRAHRCSEVAQQVNRLDPFSGLQEDSAVPAQVDLQQVAKPGVKDSDGK